MDYTITITETQRKAMEYITPDVDEWITNFTVSRADIAINEIISILVEHCNSNDIALAVGKEAQVTQAYDLGIIEAASSTSPSIPE